jgi:hypothetical protein
MPISYHLYSVGRGANILGGPEIVECADDKEAVEKAVVKADHFDIEIWDQKRLVARLPRNLPKEFSSV